MELRKYEDVMVRAAAAGTKYEAVIAHFLSTTTLSPLHHFVFSPDVEPKKMLELDKKMPDFLLIGGAEIGINRTYIHSVGIKVGFGSGQILCVTGASIN